MEMRLKQFGFGDFFFPFNEKVNSVIMAVFKETLTKRRKEGLPVTSIKHFFMASVFMMYVHQSRIHSTFK